MVKMLFSPKLISMTPSSHPVRSTVNDNNHLNQPRLLNGEMERGTPVPSVGHTFDDLPDSNRSFEVSPSDGGVESANGQHTGFSFSLDMCRYLSSESEVELERMLEAHLVPRN